MPGIRPAAAAMIVDARELGLGGAAVPPEAEAEVAAEAPFAPEVEKVMPATSARLEISFICASEARAMSPSG